MRDVVVIKFCCMSLVDRMGWRLIGELGYCVIEFVCDLIKFKKGIWIYIFVK